MEDSDTKTKALNISHQKSAEEGVARKNSPAKKKKAKSPEKKKTIGTA
jgi:hypothetical protein|tara:strand:- start:347 stop:490 length:144 start_codon:yes stop_codon:yes gene_type:complete